MHCLKLNFFMFAFLMLSALCKSTSVKGANCTCKDFINIYGYGNCEKKFIGKALCYVNLPSSCSDLMDSTTDPGEKVSFEACIHNSTEYYLGKLGTECSASEIVSSYGECEVAATKLGRHMGSAFNITFRPAGCYYLYYKNSCYFNAANLSDTFNLLPDGGGVCKKDAKSEMCPHCCKMSGGVSCKLKECTDPKICPQPGSLNSEISTSFLADGLSVDKCNGLFVKGANYADCAGTYFLLYKKVYKRKTGLDHNRYIFLMGKKWVIGTKENLARRNGFFYESTTFAKFAQPWEVQWKQHDGHSGDVTVTCDDEKRSM